MQTAEKSHESKTESMLQNTDGATEISASAFDSYTKNTAQEAQSFLI